MTPGRRRWRRWRTRQIFTFSQSTLVLSLLSLLQQITAIHHMARIPPQDLSRRQNAANTPLIITNKCGNTIYPGILTQSGVGPGTGGFRLNSNSTRSLTVSENWQGRVWGRTNCTFNTGGTGQCGTGDCGGILNCIGTGNVPTTLVEFTLDAGDGHTYYDISLVDGYSIPIGLILQPGNNVSLEAIPPNLTNPICIGTVGNLQPPGYDPYSSGQANFMGTNSSSPLSFNQNTTLSQVAQWCPWDLQLSSSTGPSGDVYIYPDGDLNRPQFDPCYSACSRYNKPQDCCTGSYSSPQTCSPSAYSTAAKTVCPDAYSYAFDDQTSTFIIPSGSGFEVVFCPGGRSTNIIATSNGKLTQLAQTGHVKRDWDDAISGDPPASVTTPTPTPKKSSSGIGNQSLRAYATFLRRLLASSILAFWGIP